MLKMTSFASDVLPLPKNIESFLSDGSELEYKTWLNICNEKNLEKNYFTNVFAVHLTFMLIF